MQEIEGTSSTENNEDQGQKGTTFIWDPMTNLKENQGLAINAIKKGTLPRIVQMKMPITRKEIKTIKKLNPRELKEREEFASNANKKDTWPEIAQMTTMKLKIIKIIKRCRPRDLKEKEECALNAKKKAILQKIALEKIRE